MRDYKTESIRNVVLLSHSGAGKTSLSEAMLFVSGAISRLGRTDDGTTTSDYEPEEIKRRISINLAPLPCEWKDHKLNIIDTPGYADFVCEVRAAVRVADAALIVVCAASGVEVGTTQTWAYADESKLPRIVLINKVDRENADFVRTFDQLKGVFGSTIPIQLPIGAQHEFKGVVDLITMKAYMGLQATEAEIPESVKEQASLYREKLVEAIAETNDDIIAKYLEGETITDQELTDCLRQAIQAGKIVPVIAGAALSNMGTSLLLDAICSYLPSPKDVGNIQATNPATGQVEELSPEASAPLSALVFKTAADPYVGKLSYFRVYSGVLSSDSQIWNATRERLERIGQLFVPRGKTQQPVSQLVAGDIGAVAKLNAAAGDTLCGRDHPVVLRPMVFPTPVFSLAVQPKTKADMDKLSNALSRLVEEDPTVVMHKETGTAETILSGMGEAQLEVCVAKLQRKVGVEVVTSLPVVPYRETISMPVKAEYKHKKQTGGHGQYGHVLLELEPLSRGGGVEFAEKVVGGSVPRNYIPAVEKGVMEAVQQGVLAGYPVADVKVSLYDGSSHPVDSSEMAFKIAGSYAVKKGLSQGQPKLLEPIVNLKVVAPEAFTGDIMGDLNSKRAKVLGMVPQDGSNIIEAQAPLAEIQRYATDLRSITQGRGSFTMEFSHYEEVPAHITQKIISQKEAAKA